MKVLALVVLTAQATLPAGEGDGRRVEASPDGRWRLEVVSEEVKMSHWIDRPSVYRRDETVPLWEPPRSWSLLRHRWLEPDTLDMEIRVYPGDEPPFKVRLNLLEGTTVREDLSVEQE